MNSILTIEYRCKCGKLLFKGLLLKDNLNTKCLRCGEIYSFEGIGVFDNPNRFLLLTNTSGEIINVSASVENILGYPVDDLIGQNISFLLVDDTTIEADSLISEKSQGKSNFRIDSSYLKKDGTKLSTSVRYKCFEINENKSILRIVDIVQKTDLNLLSGENFGNTFIGDFTAETDEDNILLYISPEVEEIFGYRPEELIGHSVRNYQLKKEVKSCDNNLKKIQDNRKAYRTIGFKTLTKDGRLIYYDIYGVPFYGDNGDFIGYNIVSWLK